MERAREIEININAGSRRATVKTSASLLESEALVNELELALANMGLGPIAKLMAKDLVAKVKLEEGARLVAAARAGTTKGRAPAAGGRLVFVAAKNWWDGNFGGIQGFFCYVEGFYEIVHGMTVEAIIVEPSTYFVASGKAYAGQYDGAILLTGHGDLVGRDYILEGGINGSRLLGFLDTILVKGAGRKGVCAGMCFAGYAWVKSTWERVLNSEIKGGDLMSRVYSSTDVVPEEEKVFEGNAFRFSWSGAGWSIIRSVNAIYGLGEELPYYVDYYEATRTYVVGPMGK
jgi:hypothetical protein